MLPSMPSQTEKTDKSNEDLGPYTQKSAPAGGRHRRTQSHRKEIQLPIDINQSNSLDQS